jgi:hypothetical protein
MTQIKRWARKIVMDAQGYNFGNYKELKDTFTAEEKAAAADRALNLMHDFAFAELIVDVGFFFGPIDLLKYFLQGQVSHPFGAEQVRYLVNLLGLHRITGAETNISIAAKFGGKLAKGQPIPNSMTALALSAVSNTF